MRRACGLCNVFCLHTIINGMSQDKSQAQIGKGRVTGAVPCRDAKAYEPPRLRTEFARQVIERQNCAKRRVECRPGFWCTIGPAWYKQQGGLVRGKREEAGPGRICSALGQARTDHSRPKPPSSTYSLSPQPSQHIHPQQAVYSYPPRLPQGRIELQRDCLPNKAGTLGTPTTRRAGIPLDVAPRSDWLWLVEHVVQV